VPSAERRVYCTPVAPPTGFATRRTMGRWPDNPRSNLTAFALIFVLFPLLAWACVWIMRR
ncbi:MAG TPA: hypothetical protein PLR25_27835, partial [Planctomycetaceae bacterium]|nr:hypothetical protein [Planctomycetaceae bacterium]